MILVAWGTKPSERCLAGQDTVQRSDPSARAARPPTAAFRPTASSVRRHS